MAYAAVTSLMGTIYLHFLQLQPRLPLEDVREMDSLHENLGFLQEILEKSEIAYDNVAMKDLEAEIRDVSFKAEERIEMELSTIYLQSSSTMAACLYRLHGIFNQAVKQIDYLKKKLIRIKSEQQLAKDSSIIGVSLLGWMRRRGLLCGSTSSQPADKKRENIKMGRISKKASKFDSRMVGCDKEFMTMLNQLTGQSAKQLQVVSIVGMGGIGKTTLAHIVYEDPSITSHFDMRAWVTVSQEYDVEQMLRCLIGCVIAASRDERSYVLEEQRNPRDKLAESLRKLLKGQRYLIVMDDIWSTNAWDSVQRCFPDDNNGSRILLTSRIGEVAEYASSGNSPLNMPFLDADESWNLYCKVFGEAEFPFEFEQIGRDIVKKCEGLPLAIIVVASLLSKTEELEKWKNFAENVSRLVISNSDNDACSRVLYLSYNQLPHHLKACFLYFGIFREDYEIPVKKLVRLWAAEGFLRALNWNHQNWNHQNMEEVALKCLQDLVDRSLVIVSKQMYNGEMKRIRIHDLLRDLCLREARCENLLNVIGDEKLTSQDPFSEPCWISDRSSCFNNQIRFKCFRKSLVEIRYSVGMEHLFSHFKLLRVVDMLIYKDGDKVLNVLANLVHLRYLALSRHPPGIFFAFYVKLFEHWNMQSFIVRGWGVELDSSKASGIWKMPLLRNFYAEQILSLETSPIVHRNLENISWLDLKFCTKDLFTRIPNLKKLGINWGPSTNPNCFYNLVHLRQLEKLSIRRWMDLKHIPCNIPWATSFPPNLKKLKLDRTLHLPWSDMSHIGMLPNLEVLKLIQACNGQEWEASEGGFCKLKRLVIENTELRYWNAVGDHFPVLECLELRECEYLQEIPIGFADITTLALIQLNNCWDSLLASAKRIQDEQQNYGNDALLVRSENIWPTKSSDWLEGWSWNSK